MMFEVKHILVSEKRKYQQVRPCLPSLQMFLYMLHELFFTYSSMAVLVISASWFLSDGVEFMFHFA